jgi:hypothetical protein
VGVERQRVEKPILRRKEEGAKAGGQAEREEGKRELVWCSRLRPHHRGSGVELLCWNGRGAAPVGGTQITLPTHQPATASHKFRLATPSSQNQPI